MADPLKSIPVKPSEITPHALFLSRREFLKTAGLMSGAALLAACAPAVTATTFPIKTDEFGDPATSFEDITSYNNYYEFSENKEAVQKRSKDFQSHPWTIEVSGLVRHPQTYAIEELIRKFPQEE